MKKLLFSFLMAVTAFSVVNAQFTKIGGGLDFTSGYKFHKMDFVGNKSGNFAITLKGIYKINVPLQISPTFTFLFPHVYKTPDGYEKDIVTTMMLDVNGHYVFNSLDRFEFYGLAGLDVLLGWRNTKYTGETPYKESDNALGLNVGIGSNMKLTNQFDLYAEAKYLVSKYSQIMVNAGILINLDWLKKHEEKPIN